MILSCCFAYLLCRLIKHVLALPEDSTFSSWLCLGYIQRKASSELVPAYMPQFLIATSLSLFVCFKQVVLFLELYILACMKRLEDKEQNSYNFNSVMIGTASGLEIDALVRKCDAVLENFCPKIAIPCWHWSM
ncbi:hypothetical protein IFM89_009933, partial [Coptis chinensis]